MIRSRPERYVTADYLRNDCDLRLDMSQMPEVQSESYDTVIAFDVLEHVPFFEKAIEEVRRILSKNGFAVLTVPQKDDLQTTYEDPTIITPAERKKHFGQSDHLRLFGADFPQLIRNSGFSVISVNERTFPPDVRQRHVLAPSRPSRNPLATNHRSVFFCQKLS